MKKRILAALLAAALCCALASSASAYTGVASYFTQEISAADSQGIIPEMLEDTDLSLPISRREFCHVIMAAYDADSANSGWDNGGWYDDDWNWWGSSSMAIDLSQAIPVSSRPDWWYVNDDGSYWAIDEYGNYWVWPANESEPYIESYGEGWYDDDDWYDDEEEDTDSHLTSPFSDVDDDVITRAYQLGYVSGYEDGTFHPDAAITRQEMFKMMYALLEHVQWVDPLSDAKASAFLKNYTDGAAVADWARSATATLLYYGVVTGTGTQIDLMSSSSRAQAIVLAYRVLNNTLTPSTLPLHYDTYSDMSLYLSSSLCDPENWYGDWDREDYIFDGGARYATQEESASHMVTVKVPVWKLKSDGTKYSSTASITVHEKLEHIVWAIFNEIYNDPEQFPISDVGGYSWRGNGSSSEHNWGLAIDINSNSNPQIWGGVVQVGTAWQPGVDPYSIPADGSVVRIFAKYGFSWGGNAWGPDNLDYMHFSYLGT